MITTSSSYRMKGARSDHAEDEQERRQSTGKNLGGAGSMTLTTPPWRSVRESFAATRGRCAGWPAR